MYLSDTKISDLLPHLGIVTDTGRPFRPDEQVQPCSIDLTLSPVFWRSRGGGTVDLRRSQLQELSPRHNWRRVILDEGESILVRPGELLLGRTSEKFSMPPGFAGNLHGRSSFARLGLMVHCTGGFVNPGWRGHMPLQLVNLSSSPIRLVPGIPICQLSVIEVNASSGRVYGQKELQSKYMDDDGGPSYWWRDDRIRRLQDRLGKSNLAEGIRQKIVALMGPQEPAVVARFQKDLDTMPTAHIDNAEAIVETFTKREDKRRSRLALLRGVLIAQFPALALGCLANSVFSRPIGSWHWLTWLITPLSGIVAWFAWQYQAGDFFGKKEHDTLKILRDHET
jgi:deoxycytidine triphosphate deaminase